MNFVLRRRFRSPANACDPTQNPVVPFGANGAGQWTGHPVGAVIALGIVLMGLIGVPSIREGFLLSCPIGIVFGVLLWRRHRHALFPGKIMPIGQLGGGVAGDRSIGWIVGSGVLLIAMFAVPLVRLFALVALPVGLVVGLFLWWRQARYS